MGSFGAVRSVHENLHAPSPEIQSQRRSYTYQFYHPQSLVGIEHVHPGRDSARWRCYFDLNLGELLIRVADAVVVSVAVHGRPSSLQNIEPL